MKKQRAKGTVLSVVLICLTIIIVATLAIVPIAMNNGRRGFIHGPVAKYILYAFYPVHILLLVLLRNRLA